MRFWPALAKTSMPEAYSAIPAICCPRSRRSTAPDCTLTLMSGCSVPASVAYAYTPSKEGATLSSAVKREKNVESL